MIDHHAHPFALQGGPLDVSTLTLDVIDDDDRDERRRRDGPSRLFHELLTVRLSQRLACDAEELSERRADASRDWEPYARGLFADAGITDLVMDAGYAPGGDDQLAELGRLSGCGIHPILRVDTMVDEMIGRDESAQAIVRAVEDAMRGAVERGAVGFKTILAYRTGLAVDPGATMRQADESLRSEDPVRRRGKALRDVVMRRVLAVAGELGRPLQIHTGMGDSDIRLAEANPLLLEEILRTPEGRSAKVALIHGSWPWNEELAYLAATKPNVWAEISLSNIFSPITTADRLLRMLDVAPATKLLMATDGHLEPELFWFAALVLQDAWREVSQRLSAAGARPGWLGSVERMIFTDNTKALYGI